MTNSQEINTVMRKGPATCERPAPRSVPMLRVLVFFAVSAAASAFPLAFGKLLWPEGLSAGTETLFWPATGVNVAGLLVLGPRYSPLIFLSTVAGLLFLQRPVGWSAYTSLGNMAEALLAWWLLVRVGKFGGHFQGLRIVLALLGASLAAPLCSSLTGVAGLVYRGMIPQADYWRGMLVWNLANGAAMLILTPFLIALLRKSWIFPRHPRETLAWLAAGILGVSIGFDVFLRGGEINFAFLAFPFVVYAAVRFGPAETAAALFLVMVAIYWSLARHAPELPPPEISSSIWFVQSFCWMLAATGLVVAALVCERRNAETLALEASLREERAKLDALRYQINPHFLFNTLNSLRATLPPAADQSRDMVTELAEYLRSTLARPDGDFAALRTEIQWAEHYLSIEKKRFGDKLEASIFLDPSAGGRDIPVFLLQPLVENAIRHGFKNSKHGFRLEIRAALHGPRLVLEVANTGQWQERDFDSRKGLGLENIRQRLRLLYGENASLRLDARDGWVRAVIELPAGKDLQT